MAHWSPTTSITLEYRVMTFTTIRPVVTIVIVPLLLPTLFDKRGIFTHPPYCGYSKPSHFFVIIIGRKKSVPLNSKPTAPWLEVLLTCNIRFSSFSQTRLTLKTQPNPNINICWWKNFKPDKSWNLLSRSLSCLDNCPWNPEFHPHLYHPDKHLPYHLHPCPLAEGCRQSSSCLFCLEKKSSLCLRLAIYNITQDRIFSDPFPLNHAIIPYTLCHLITLPPPL